MKKAIVVLCFFFVAMCATASAEVSLDFTYQTNGLWEYEEGAAPIESCYEVDQIYSDTEAVNADLPMLVPPAGEYMEITQGWSTDRSVYVTGWSDFSLNFSGLEPGVLYRAALFVPQADGGIGEHYTTLECDWENSGWVYLPPISCYPGVYEDVTVVVTGNGEVYTHTFNVQIQNIDEWVINNRNEGYYEGLYYGDYASPEFMPKNGSVKSDEFIKPESGIAIAAPTAGEVYTGYEGVGGFECFVALDRMLDMEDDKNYSVTYTLTELATGKVVAQDLDVDFGIGWGTNEKLSFLVSSINLPEMLNEGEYQLSVEAFQFDVEAGTYEPYDIVSLGTDTVSFFLEKEYDPTDIYAQYLQEKLRFNLKHGWNASWNDDYTHLTINETPNLHFELLGMKPGVPYRVALIGKTVTDEEFVYSFCCEAESEERRRSEGWINISNQSGEYKNLTLMAYSADELVFHTFDCTVNLLPENEQEGVGNVFGSYDDADYFALLGGFPESMPQPESGCVIHIPENSVFSGYTGNVLTVPCSFGPEYNAPISIETTLTEEATNKVIKEAAFDFDTIEDPLIVWGLIIYDDFDPGAYILHVTANGQDAQVRIILEKEKTPAERYAEHMDKLDAIPEYSAEGEIVYRGEEYSIIPEIKDYLAAMPGFDTDMFNQFLRYRYTPIQGMMGSFALNSPNVTESEKTIDQEDLLFTANCLMRDIYTFQLKDIRYYSDAKFIDIDKLNAFFGDAWKELDALDHATGMAKANDGTVYIWMPVYFEGEQGGFANNELYLFVYVLYTGADANYLDETGFFNPEFYNDYHTTQLLITDQVVVANMLNKLNSINSAISTMEDTNNYTVLRLGSEGEYVRRLQKRLQKLGYLNTSVDAVFSQPVMEAVMAWQRDQGLPETGVVSAEMQRMLHDSTIQRGLLMNWLNDHQ